MCILDVHLPLTERGASGRTTSLLIECLASYFSPQEGMNFMLFAGK